MEQNGNLYLKKEDFVKISSLLASAPIGVRDLLQEELDRAIIISNEHFPKEVVTMHSTVEYLDLESNKKNEVTLVYPHEVVIDENKISVLAPIGAALIGLQVGQKIGWPLPNGKKKWIEVLRVMTQ